MLCVTLDRSHFIGLFNRNFTVAAFNYRAVQLDLAECFFWPKFLRELKMKKAWLSLWMDDSGATAIEYGLIASLIAIAVIAGAKSLGSKLSDTFANVAGNLS